MAVQLTVDNGSRLDSFLLLCSLLTGIVLIFFVVAHIVLCFGFVMKNSVDNTLML